MPYKTISFFLFLSLPLVAQSNADYGVRYQKALEFVKTANYEKARAAFGELIARKYNNDYVPYSHYFAGLSSIKTHNFFEAKQIFRQLFERYPNWKKNDDAYQQMALAMFATNDFKEALHYTRQINNPEIKPQTEAMEDMYLKAVEDISLMKALYDAFPENRILALNLADLVQRKSTDKKDLELSDRITNRYGVKQSPQYLSEKNTTPPTSPTENITPDAPAKKNNNKGYFNVGILFPFKINEIDQANRAKNNQFALDMYEGIKLAKQQLQTEGIILNLFAYDIDNKPEQMLELVNNTGFRQMDMLVGPLHAESNKIAVGYCNLAQIPIINPLATDANLLLQQALVYNAKPSLETQAKKLDEFAEQLFNNNEVAVFYQANKNDSLLAVYYQNEVKRMGKEVKIVGRITHNTAEVWEAVLGSNAKPNGHIFFAGSSKYAGVALLNALDKRKWDTPIITSSDVFNWQTMSNITLNGREIYMAGLDFIDNQKAKIKAMQSTYTAKHGTLASVFTFQGYDLLLFWGRMLATNREKLPIKSYQEGFMLSGFDYTQSNENQVVPILRYENFQLVPVR